MSPRTAPDVLRTERLVGTRVAVADLEDLAAMYGDARMMATLSSDGRPWARERVVEVLGRHVEHWSVHGFGTWVFRDRLTGAFVGRAGLHRWYDAERRGVELYYAVAAERWGAGLATEVSRRIIDVAFGELALDALVAFSLPANRGSLRVLEKCGFERLGEIVHAGLPHLRFRLARPADRGGERQR